MSRSFGDIMFKSTKSLERAHLLKLQGIESIVDIDDDIELEDSDDCSSLSQVISKPEVFPIIVLFIIILDIRIKNTFFL